MSQDIYSQNVDNIQSNIASLKEKELENYSDVAENLQTQAQDKVSDYMDKWKAVQDAGLDDLAGVMGVKGVFVGGKQVYNAYRKFKQRNEGKEPDEGEPDQTDDIERPSNPNINEFADDSIEAPQLNTTSELNLQNALIGSRSRTGTLRQIDIEPEVTDRIARLKQSLQDIRNIDPTSLDDPQGNPFSTARGITQIEQTSTKPVSSTLEFDPLDFSSSATMGQADVTDLSGVSNISGATSRVGLSNLAQKLNLSGGLRGDQTLARAVNTQQPTLADSGVNIKTTPSLSQADVPDIPDVPSIGGTVGNITNRPLPELPSAANVPDTDATSGILDGIFGEGSGASALGEGLAATGEIGLAVGGLVAIGEGIYHLFHSPSTQTKAPAAPDILAPEKLTQKFSMALPSVDNSLDRSGSSSF